MRQIIMRLAAIGFVIAGLRCFGPVTSVAIGGDVWTPLAPMQVARQETGAARIGNKVYVVGGLLDGFVATNTVEVYDIGANQWTFAAPLPTPSDHMAVAAINGLLYVIGGYTGEFDAQSAVWVYDPAMNSWTAETPLPQARGACWAVAHDGFIYVFGGVDSSGVTRRTTYRFDPTSHTWVSRADMPTAREHLTATSLGDFVYVVGGRNGSASAANERYDPATNTWQTMTPMPTARSATFTAALDGRLYVAGGEVPMLFSVHEVYDPATNVWSTAAPMIVPRHGISAVVLDDRILAPGGGTVQGLDPTTYVDAYIPLQTVVPAMSSVGMLAAGILMTLLCVVFRRKARNSVHLCLGLMASFLATGCIAPGDAILTVDQEVTVEVTDSSSGLPVSNALVTLLEISDHASSDQLMEALEQHAEQAATTNTDGITTPRARTITGCGGPFIFYPVVLPLYNSCPFEARVDRVSNDEFYIRIETDQTSEILSGVMVEGTTLHGELFSITIVSIGDPVEVPSY